MILSTGHEEAKVKFNNKSSPWAVALVVSGMIAILECVVGLLFYHDLPLNTIRFFLVYGTLYTAGTAILAGTSATLAVLVLKKRVMAIAIGLSVVWFIIFALRGYRITMICSGIGIGSSIPLWPFIIVAAIASVVFGIIAYFVGKSSIGKGRIAFPVIVLIAIIGSILFLSHVKPVSVSQKPDPVNLSEFVSTIDPETTNILLITIDTLRADHTSLYGYGRETTPNLKELAEQGVLFERCITQRTSTAASIAALMTGTYPPTNRVLNNKNILQDFNVTIAELMTRYGYLTGGLSSNVACGEKYNFDQGFSSFDMVDSDGSKEQDEKGSQMLNSSVLDWLKKHYSERFFLWVHYVDPHTPYSVPEEYKNLYTSDSLSSANQHHQLKIGNSKKGCIGVSVIVDDSRDQDFYISQYDTEIWYNDQSMGNLLDEVRRLGVWDNTLIIVTSDHGESLGEHNYYFSHGAYCYEPCAHVPLVISHPSLPANKRISMPVSLVDIAPTICDLLSIPISSSFQGQSFAKLMTSDQDKKYRSDHYTIGAYRPGYQSHSITTDQYKLIFDVDQRLIYMDVGVEALARLWFEESFSHRYRFRAINREFYDLTKDAAETINCNEERSVIQSEMETKLWKWMDKTYKEGMIHSIEDVDMTPDLIEKLRGLGYVQ